MAGIYIHIPSTESTTGGAESAYRPERYARAVAAELAYYAHALASNETIEAAYIGGSTSAFGEDHYRVVFEGLFSVFDTISLGEITLEVAPGRFTRDAYDGFIALGVNRIQLLAGSFFDDDLGRLGATFPAHRIDETIEAARAAGIERIGIDLCLDVPDQPFEYWGANLEKAVHRGIEHIALHRRGTADAGRWPQPHHRYYTCPPLTVQEQERYRLALEYLASSGYENYLWFEFARPGAESLQSRLYVQHANILGAGAAAHSFWWDAASHARAARWSNVEHPERYRALLAGNELPVEARSWFGLDDLGNEYIMLRLQSDDGLDALALETDYGIDLFSEKISELAMLEEKQWIEPIRGHRVRLTSQGKLHYPDVYRSLLLVD